MMISNYYAPFVSDHPNAEKNH